MPGAVVRFENGFAEGDHRVVEQGGEEEKRKDRRFWKKWCRHGCAFWCKKYFWEGQLARGATDKDFEEIVNTSAPCANLSPNRRKLVGWLLPASIFHIAYWSIMIERDLFYVFEDKYPMTITMIIGSIIAGMTSVGGGAVAFPVMALILKEPPAIARDLAMSLQACGMSAASFAIFFMHVHIETHALVLSLTGSSIGVIFGLELVDPNLTPSMKKMGFVSIFFAFAFALFMLNRDHKRKTVNNIVGLNWWKRIVLLLTGFCGGLFTSFSGSGADICMFSVLTLLFKVSEKVATPTSVVLMAMTSVVAWFWRALVTQAMPLESWEYLLVVVPIVTVGAPFGSLIGTHFHRLVLAACVYIIDTAALVGAFCIVPQTPALAGGSVGLIFLFFVVFFVLAKIGDRLHQQHLVENQKRLVKRLSMIPTPNNIIISYDNHGHSRTEKGIIENGVFVVDDQVDSISDVSSDKDSNCDKDDQTKIDTSTIENGVFVVDDQIKMNGHASNYATKM